MNELTVLNHLPETLLERAAPDLHQVLDGPTLIHLSGRDPTPLFVSVLLHGNETTGWEAMRGLLKKYEGRTLPRALSLFLGNIMAARQGVRRLDRQPDFNRVWPSDEANESDAPAGREAKIMSAVVAEMRTRDCFASIDIHNNTGSNPHYGCVNRLEGPYLHLARLFSRTIIYFLRPLGVQSMAFAQFCPAVTVECGKSDDQAGIAHAMDFVETVLHLERLDERTPAAREYDLFHTVATIKVPEEASFSFEDPKGRETDLHFSADLDRMNFQEIGDGALFARTRHPARLTAWDENGREVGADYFEYRAASGTPRDFEYEVRLKKSVMPSMLTVNPKIVRQDCLGYFMERLSK
ncbi:MAG: M14 family metallopeptidase [bacterium]|nr:M14 family metallopeptidase [bacterium]